MINKKKFDGYLKRFLELYALPVKAKVTKSYTESGKYFIDCKKMDCNDAVTEVIYPKVPVPKLLGLDKGGLFCIPCVESIVNIGFYEGDINRPFVMSVLGSGHDIEHQENIITIKYNETEIIIKDGKITQRIGNDSTISQSDNNFLIGGDKTTDYVIKGDTLKIELEKIRILLDVLQKTFSGWTPVPEDGGAALKAAVTGFINLPLPDYTNILSKYAKVK